MMTLRKTWLVLVMALLMAGLAAITMEDLQSAAESNFVPTVMAVTAEDGSDSLAVVPPTEAEMASADELFAQFMEEDRPLKELEEAAIYWQDMNADGYKTWIEAKTADPASPLKFFYLWFLDQEDPLSIINAARQLILNYPDQVYGYRLMTIAYFENFPIEDYFDDPDAVKEMLDQDVTHFMTYYQKFSQDDYSRLAGVWAYNKQGSTQDASDLFAEAYLSEDPWLDMIDPSRMQPIEEFHELLFTFARMIMTHDDSFERGSALAAIRADLVPYYFEDAIDYSRVILLLAGDQVAFEDYYQRFALASSYHRTEDYQMLKSCLVDEEDITDSITFQNAWINYDVAQAREVYNAALQDEETPLASYLLSRLETDKSTSIKAARQMIKDDPRGLFGYQLLGETYWNYFSTAAPDDSARADWLKWIRKDNSRLRVYYVRFPDEVKAQAVYMLTQVLAGKEDRALEYYKMLLNQSPFSEEVKQTDKIMADAGLWDLLWNSKVAYIDRFIEQEMLEEQERTMYEVVGYCSALYSNAYFSKLTEDVYAHPDWLDYEDMQYMMVNSHYQLQQYGEVIDILRLMVERETIGLEELQTLEDQPIAEHATWPALMEYAAQLSGQDYQPAETSGFQAYPAPGWTLPDPEGNLVSLSDLRGQILILDFWATWCQPCRDAMPLLNEWMASDMPVGVQVFSINVWEDDPPNAIKFMNDNKYAMRLLFGDEELTTAYGIQGIPFICVIDGEGMVRGVEKGYSPTLKDTLNAWINEILAN